MWITVNFLGNPDNGVIIASYIGSLLMAGGYLAIGSFVSALTKNQVIAFIIAVTACFLFTLSGLPIVLDFFSSWAGDSITDTIASFSFLKNFTNISRGIIDFRSILYFISLILLFLYFNTVVIDNTKD
jgi:ABC-2 type transport system permease protein